MKQLTSASISIEPTDIGKRYVTVILWIVNLFSICSSTLSYVYLSYYIYTATNNLILSQAVLFSPMVLPVLFVTQIHKATDLVSSRMLLVSANALSAIVCAIVYILLGSVPLIALLGGVLIGTLDALQRVARIVAIKHYFSTSDVASTVPLTLTAQFIAGGLAGGAMAALKTNMTPMVALFITCGLFVVGAIAAVMLPALTQSPLARKSIETLWTSFFTLLRGNNDLRRSFWTFIIFVGVFQGFFNVSRVSLPAHVLHLSQGYVGLLQAINSIAALAGAIIYYTLNRRGMRLPPLLMTMLSAVFMATAASGNNVAISYGAYFFYIFFFELAFFRLQADVVVHSPPQEIPMVASVQYAGVYAAMILTIFIGGLLVDKVGLLCTSIIFLITYAAVLFKWPDTFRHAEQSVK